jgi:hypothetical protein
VTGAWFPQEVVHARVYGRTWAPDGSLTKFERVEYKQDRVWVPDAVSGSSRKQVHNPERREESAVPHGGDHGHHHGTNGFSKRNWNSSASKPATPSAAQPTPAASAPTPVVAESTTGRAMSVDVKVTASQAGAEATVPESSAEVEASPTVVTDEPQEEAHGLVGEQVLKRAREVSLSPGKEHESPQGHKDSSPSEILDGGRGTAEASESVPTVSQKTSEKPVKKKKKSKGHSVTPGKASEGSARPPQSSGRESRAEVEAEAPFQPDVEGGVEAALAEVQAAELEADRQAQLEADEEDEDMEIKDGMLANIAAKEKVLVPLSETAKAEISRLKLTGVFYEGEVDVIGLLVDASRCPVWFISKLIALLAMFLAGAKLTWGQSRESWNPKSFREVDEVLFDATFLGNWKLEGLRKRLHRDKPRGAERERKREGYGSLLEQALRRANGFAPWWLAKRQVDFVYLMVQAYDTLLRDLPLAPTEERFDKFYGNELSWVKLGQVPLAFMLRYPVGPGVAADVRGFDAAVLSFIACQEVFEEDD